VPFRVFVSYKLIPLLVSDVDGREYLSLIRDASDGELRGFDKSPILDPAAPHLAILSILCGLERSMQLEPLKW